MNKLRKIFNNDPPNPSDPFIKQIEEAIRKSHEERWCLSCAHCVPEDDSLPDFVTDGPTCDLGGDSALESCDKYKEGMTLEEELRILYGKEEIRKGNQ